MGRIAHDMRWHARIPFFVLAMAVVRAAAADPVTVTWDPSPDSGVVGYVVYVGTQSGAYTTNYDVGNTSYFVFPDATAGQLYFFSVAAYVPGPIIGPASAEVSGFSDAPPVLVDPGSQTSAVGAAATLRLEGSDPYGQPVNYGAVGLPPGLEIAASTGFIAGTPTTAGTYTVTAKISDGVLTDSATFTWSVTPAPTDSTAPVVTITLPTTSDTYSTSYVFVTLGGTTVDDSGVAEVTWSNDRGGAGRATGTDSWIAGIPLQRGPNTIAIEARDGAGNVSRRSITVKATGNSK